MDIYMPIDTTHTTSSIKIYTKNRPVYYIPPADSLIARRYIRLSVDSSSIHFLFLILLLHSETIYHLIASKKMAAVMHNLLNMVAIPEIVLRQECLDDSLAAIINTILYIRAPNTENAIEHRCTDLVPLIFMKCGHKELDRSVSLSIQKFKNSFSVGQKSNTKGEIVISFFYVNKSKNWGIFERLEHVFFEKWRVPVLVINNSQDSIQERDIQHAYEQVSRCIVNIIENSSPDNVPSMDFEFEITHS